MKEYTLAALLSLALPFVLEAFYRTGIFRRPVFYVTLIVMFFFMFFVNGHLTSVPVVLYNPSSFSGLRLGTIPAEDFLFAFSMVVSTLIFWEYFKRRES